MFKRFIVATDLSPASFAVVSCLNELQSFGAKDCLLLQCLSFMDAASAALSYDTERLKEMLDEQKTILENQGFTVEARTISGTPKQEIVRIADKEDYTLIVIGSQGQSLMEEKLLGGVAYGIVTKSVKPVLVIPVQKRPGEEVPVCDPVVTPERLRRCHVMFAADFSETADRAFSYVEQSLMEEKLLGGVAYGIVGGPRCGQGHLGPCPG